MKIEPVEFTPDPGYPDKYSAQSRKALVAAKPRRWLGAPLALSVLSATVTIGVTGCGGPFVTAGVPVMTPTTVVTETGVPVSSPTPTDIENIVLGMMTYPISNLYATLIPLFEYGDGTGAIGCVAVASPVFLSEEEAYAVLLAAFSEAGLSFVNNAYTIYNATIPETDLYGSFSRADLGTVQGDLISDGLLGVEDGLPVEFVSSHDIGAWQKNTDMRLSVSTFAVKDTAWKLAENNPGLAVFYDPVTYVDTSTSWDLEREDGESDEKFWERWNAMYEEECQAALAESKQLLREQALAFIEWLRREGHC